MNRTGMNGVMAMAISSVLCLSAGAGVKKPDDGIKRLTVHPASAAAGAKELLLWPKPEELTDANAVDLYARAIKALPEGLDWGKIQDWRKMPMNQLPQGEVAAVLEKTDASLSLLEQAARCKQCEWPIGADGGPSINLQSLRNMVFLLAVKARSQLARGDHASCVRTLGTGLGLAKHFSEGQVAIHLLVGVAVSAVMYSEIEQYIQQPGAPSLEAAIRAIPKPLFDEKHSDLYGMDEASRSRTQLLLGRANRHAIALQYIETLRLYATKAGKWPQTLDELKATLPNDPVTGKPFSYKRVSDTAAAIDGPMPKGGDAKDVVRYELTLVK